MRFFFISLLCFLCSFVHATDTDTLFIKPTNRFQKAMDKISSSPAYQITYIGVPLIVGGLIVKSEDDHFRSLRNDYAPKFNQKYDNYLQYLPAVAMVGMKLGGVKGRSSWGRMLTSDAFSAIIMAAAVNSLKYSVRTMRPDGSSRNSFPSGHTATAFMTATMMHKEYGCRSPWYSIGAYSIATATGITRQLNNRHWLSDVMVGAGIGIISTELGYFLADLIFKDKGITKYTDTQTFERLHHPSFFGIYMGFNFVANRYRLSNGSLMQLHTGSNAGTEGAWFMNPYVGFGGRFSVSSMPVKIGTVDLKDNMDFISSCAGAYFSYPLSCRWTVGSKMLLGYNYYSYGNALSTELGSTQKDGMNIGTGLSLNLRVQERFGVKFLFDYNLMSSPVQTRKKFQHMMTLGASTNVIF